MIVAEILWWDFVFLLMVVAFIGVPLWAIIDLAGRPDGAFDGASTSKSTWIVLILVLTLACGLPGLVLSLVYLFGVRPKLPAT